MRWLVHDDQKDLFTLLLALVLNLLFLGLIALLLWPLGNLTLAFRLAKGYGALWIITSALAVLINQAQRLFRVNIYDHPDAYVNSNLAASCCLQAGWAAFAALAARDSAGQPIWMLAIVYMVAAVSCLIAFLVVSSFYQGEIYKLISLPLALASLLVFCLWPASGHALYGWLFQLF